MKKVSRPAGLIGAGLFLLLSALFFSLPGGGRALFSALSSAFQERPAASKNRKTIWLATGLSTGAYVKLGHAIAHVAKDEGLDVHVCTTNGSLENLKLLQRHKVINFALVQDDSLHETVFPHTSSQEDGQKAGEAADKKQQLDGGISLVSHLYSEKLHLLVRPHYYVSSPKELLRVKDRVWLGPEHSGTRATAKKVLQASGLIEDDISLFPPGNGIDWRQAGEKLFLPIHEDKSTRRLPLLSSKEQGLYAFFWTGAVAERWDGHPSTKINHPLPTCEDVVKNPADAERVYIEGSSEETEREKTNLIDSLLDRDSRIVGLPTEILDRMSEDKLYVKTAIPLRAYPHMNQGVQTVGIQTVLITNLPRQDADAKELVQTLIQVIQKNKSGIEDRIGGIELDLWDQKVAQGEDKNRQTPIHSGAEDHLKPTDPTWTLLLSSGLIVGVLFALFFLSPKWFRRNLVACAYGVLLAVLLFGMWSTFALEMQRAEGRFNPEFNTPLKSMQTMLLYVFGRSHGHDLMTRQGQTIVSLALILIPLVFGWLTSDVLREGVRRLSVWIAGLISRAGARGASAWFFAMARTLKRPVRSSERSPAVDKEHIVIVNWDSRTAEILRRLPAGNGEGKRAIVVVSSSQPQPPFPDNLSHVRLVVGDPASREILQQAGVASASEVTILSSWPPADLNDRRKRVEPDLADSKTILTILKIRSLCRESRASRDVPIKAEILVRRNLDEARYAGAGGRTEIVSL